MRILFIGGDARMGYAAKKLAEKHEISYFGGEEPSAPDGCFDAIILPLPLSKDGGTVYSPDEQSPLTFDKLSEKIKGYADEHTVVFAGGEAPAVTEMCARLGCKFVNYFANEALTLQNAALTAEAALCLLSQSTDGSLLGSRILVTGSGRIAVFLAERLRACGAAVTFAARNQVKRELFKLNGYSAIPLEELSCALPDFDFTANTVPAPIFGEEMFSKMRKASVFEELASLPRQPWETFANRYSIKYIYAGGLPGKYSPRSAGEYIARAVIEETERIDANE